MVEGGSNDGQILLKLLQIITGKIKGPATDPELFACFPQKDRVKRSERFIPGNFLGQSYMKNGYRVDYAKGQHTYQLFLIRNASPEAAKNVFTEYQGFLAPGEEGLQKLEGQGYLEFAVQEKKEYAFQYDAFVGGILNAPDPEEAHAILEEFIGSLKKR